MDEVRKSVINMPRLPECKKTSNTRFVVSSLKQ